MLVYLVDDEESIRQTVAMALSSLGIESENREFLSADDALAELQSALEGRQALPELIVSGIRMPGIDGLTLCRWIKAQQALVDVPVILISGADSEIGLCEIFSVGADDFIRKPLVSAELMARLHAATSKNTTAAIRRQAFQLAEKELIYSQSLVSSISNMGVGLLVVEKGRLTFVNPALCRLTGHSERDLYAFDSYTELFHPDERARIASNHRRRMAGEQIESRYETALQHRSGEKIEVEFSVAFWENPPHNGVVCLVRDIREQLEMQRQLRAVADFDSLTGLPNRRVLQDRIKHALQRCTRSKQEVALLFIDLDGFKAVNDNMGHVAGDELLQQVALRLKVGLRASDTAARLAGDEFVLILEPDPEGLLEPEVVAKKLLEQLRKPYVLSGGVATVTGSIGVVRTRGDPDTVEGLLSLADKAMYHVKQTGKDGFWVLQR